MNKRAAEDMGKNCSETKQNNHYFYMLICSNGLLANPSRLLDASLAVTPWEIPVTIKHHGAKPKTN